MPAKPEGKAGKIILKRDESDGYRRLERRWTS